jgi:Rieske 2Fe-2S family protein
VASSQPRFSSTLPGRYYYDPAIFERERERLFGRLWTCVGLAQQLPRPGDFRTVELAGESILLLRTTDDELRAFYNVCRHRGARLCTTRQGHASGALQCLYHAWTYALDGRLIGAPNILQAADFDRTAYGLLPVPLTLWQGLLWLSLAEQPPSLATQIGPALFERFGDQPTFDRYTVGHLTAARTLVYSVAANWKIIVENFTECYHCSPVHPEFVRLLPGFRTATAYSGPGYAGTPLADDVEAFSITGRASRSRLPGLVDEDERLYYGFVLPPNVLVNLLPDHVVIHIAEPIGPAQTQVTCHWLFDPTMAVEPNFDPSDAVELFDLVNRQDWQVCELTQQGVRSRAYHHGGLYVPSEYELRQFNDFVLAHLAEEPTGAD